MIIPIILFTVLILSIGIVSATEENNTKTITKDSTDIKEATPTKNIYLNPKGNDNNNGNSKTPKKTLKNAVKTSTTNTTIHLSKGTYYTSNVYIDKNITILGEKSSNTIIDGNKSHIFTIKDGCTVTIKAVTIRNAYANNGAAIYNKGTLTLDGVKMYSSTATNGAAVYNKATLTSIKTSYLNNTAKNGSSIYNVGKLVIEKSAFTNNKASTLASAVYSTNKITISNTNFTKNTNTAVFINSPKTKNTIKNSVFTSNTGVNGAAIFDKNSPLNITTTYFKDNTATNYAGGVYTSGKTSITQSTFISNSAMYGAAITGKNTLIVTSSKLVNNKAKKYGGSIYSINNITLKNTKLDNNTAELGGAIFVQASNTNDCKINTSTFTNNKAILGSGVYAHKKSRININNSVFNNNNKSAVYLKVNSNLTNSITQTVFKKNSADVGSAIYNYNSKLRVTRCEFTQNRATVHGIVYAYKSRTNITSSIFNSNTKMSICNQQGVVVANTNWWSKNTKPTDNYMTQVDNWVYFKVSDTTGFINTSVKNVLSFNYVTNGSSVASYRTNVPDMKVQLHINGCGVNKTYYAKTNNGSLEVSNTYTKTGVAKITAYTPNVKLKLNNTILDFTIKGKITSLFVQKGASVTKSNVNSWVNAGITDVYVQTRASTSDTSKLREVIKLCSGTAIRVHAWVICFSTADGFDISTKQQNMIKSFTAKVVKISGVSGVCLDYVRYSGANPNIVVPSKITNFVKEINKIVKGHNSKQIVSACVFPEKDGTKTYYGQDYAALSDYVDVLLVMAYKYDYKSGREWIKDVTRYVVNRAKKSRVVTVLQTYKETSGGYQKLSKTELELDAKAAMSAGSYGYSLFRYGLMSSYPIRATKL